MYFESRLYQRRACTSEVTSDQVLFCTLLNCLSQRQQKLLEYMNREFSVEVNAHPTFLRGNIMFTYLVSHSSQRMMTSNLNKPSFSSPYEPEMEERKKGITTTFQILFVMSS